ncbi:hypothetical protein [Flagellimonas sp. CMM7]|uniref:hypothetical protein n=1 Tax=Flagellimonas sp. CMM7 TaxID=2654676 RepID=UPI0013D290CF|nr:hypothetical protein [Flagellimonas sp. CMM7]UII80136.1 hypothetical protein LV704_01120 [Flagellimonas sp. CMM7]
MKKSILLFLAILTISFKLPAQEKSYGIISTTIDESKQLGLIAYLNTIKEISENKILWSEAKYNQRKNKRLEEIKKAKDSNSIKNLEYQQQSDDSLRQSLQNDYALLRWKSNLLINQLSADIIDKNRISIYRNMNKYLASGQDISSRLKKFKELIKTIDDIYFEVISFSYKIGGLQSVAGVQEIFTLAGINPYTIYKDIKASKEKKLATLVGYIKEMKLQSLSELTSDKEDENEDEKKDEE